MVKKLVKMLGTFLPNNGQISFRWVIANQDLGKLYPLLGKIRPSSKPTGFLINV